MIFLRFKRLHPKAILPIYATEGASGMDFATYESFTVYPEEYWKISTGWAIEIPSGYEGQVRPRSGLAFHRGVTLLNTPGTIDSDYRGEVHVALINHSHIPYTFEEGDRVAQLIISPVARASIIEVEELGQTLRGESGLGSTGR